MQFVSQIIDTYDWASRHLQAEMAFALATNDQQAIRALELKRDVLDRGTYVLLFGQFELAVNRAFKAAHGKRSTNPDWTRRRGWDMPALSGDKVPFQTKLALTLDGRSTAHGKATAAYGNRNHCAHGGTTVSVGSIAQLAIDIRAWDRQLKSS
jgi:hypothetical protein